MFSTFSPPPPSFETLPPKRTETKAVAPSKVSVREEELREECTQPSSIRRESFHHHARDHHLEFTAIRPVNVARLPAGLILISF